MADDTSANGKLMVGGIGTLLLGALLLLGRFVPSLGLGMGGGGGEGGAGIIILVLFLAILVMSGLGWFGAGSIYGAMNNIAGIFTFLMAAGILLAVVALLAMSMGLVAVAMYIMAFSPALIGIFGGIGLMTGQGRGSAGPLKPIAGIVLLIGGIGATWGALAVLGIALPLGNIMGGIVGGYGLPAGLVLAGLTKIMSRT